MKSPGISTRVFLFTAAIVCAVLAAALAVASHSGRRAAREAERRGLEQAADLTAQLLAGRWRSLGGGARVFVQGPYFRALVAERRADDILDQAFEAAEQLGADWVFITDERGLLLAKSDEPGARGVPMAGIPLVAGALEGRTTSGYGVSRDSLLFQTVAVPIVVPGAAPVGVLVATKLIDRQMALDVRAATNSDVVFYTLDRAGTPRVAATSLADAVQAAAALPAAGALPASSRPSDPAAARRALIGGAPFALQGAALTTAGGEIVGGFVVGRPENAMLREIAGVRRPLLVAGLLGLALALAAAWSAARYVTRPSRALAAAATRALDGDYDAAARAAVEATRGAPRDEIAALGGALAALLEELREKQALVAMLGRAHGGGSEARHDLLPARGVDEPSLSPPAPDPVPKARAGSPAIAWLLRARSIPRPAGALTAGTIVADRYALQEVLGSGGTGIVYKAADLTLGETVALKVLRPELVADDPRAREELKHELRLTRRVSHRNVVRTYDFGSSRGVPFLTMEYVHGASLGAVLAQHGALPSDVVLALAKQLMRALEAAHEQGVMHGDLKPANLLVAMDGFLKVTDFGVATLVRRPWARPPAPDEAVTPPQLAGAVVGTPEYMAPELLLGSPPDARTDLYAAGMVLHECLTGATPFQRDTPRAFLARKLEMPQARPSGLRTPRDPRTLEGVVAWMIAPDAEDRPTSAAEVGAALGRVAGSG
jgi:HAMP domain-containing protein